MPAVRDVLRLTLFALFFLLAAAPVVSAAESAAEAEATAEGLVSSMSMMLADEELAGIIIRPVPELSGTRYTEDYAPVQVVEIIRPEGGGVTLGRLFSSCGCLSVKVDKKTFAPGERALLEVRNVKPSLPEGATYMIFVQLEAPVAGVVRYDIFVKSDRR